MRFSSSTLLAITALWLPYLGSASEENRNLRSGSSERHNEEEQKQSKRELKPKKNFLDQIQYPYDPWLPNVPSQITQPFYDTVIDVRASVSAADTKLIVSAVGNWQYALTTYLEEQYFPANTDVQSSYLITTSPPISVPQSLTGKLRVGNIVYTDAQPHVVTGPGILFNNGLIPQGIVTAGEQVPFHMNYGNVILKLAGNNKIKSFADLTKVPTGRFASTDITKEAGATNNYRNTIKNIILNNPDILRQNGDPAEQADALLDQLYGVDGTAVATIGPPMHQSVPHMIATGQADCGLMFLELAVRIMENNPGVFEAIYLDQDRNARSSTTDPIELAKGQNPLVGNTVVTMFVSKTTSTVTQEQETARTSFIEGLLTPEFDEILARRGLRPIPRD